ncbi:MAG: hypothetical protein LAP39_04840 [Acidobacteriia bacterium]|nr:hypothetical protein [Terriglobia bacterium]
MRYIADSEKSMMRGCMILLTITAAALAQDAPVVPSAQPGTTVPSGVPLRVALEHRVAIKRVGEPVRGRLVEPVYVFDRMVLPAGSVVEGHIAEIGGVRATRRFTALLSGNLTPPRDVRAQFDTLLLSDGSRLALRTSPSRGTAHTARIATRGRKREEHQSVLKNRAASLAFKEPGKMSRLKSYLFGMLPYHRQAWQEGTLFNGVLQDPLTGLSPIQVEMQSDRPAVPRPEEMEVSARLLAPLSSATARRGALVEAVVTRPLFSNGHALLIPEGTRLLGDVVEAQPARWLHRNGKLLFVFHQIQLPSATAQDIQGQLEGVEANFDAHLALDSEGAAHTSSPKSRFIFPAIAVAVAGLSFHQDYNAQGVPDQDIGGRAESGAVGLGLIGTALAQASRSLASSIAFAGAGFSVYSTFIARGKDAVLPANTPVRISFRGARR